MNRHLRLVPTPAPSKRQAQLTFGFRVPDDEDRPTRPCTGMDEAVTDRLEAIRRELIKRGGVG